MRENCEMQPGHGSGNMKLQASRTVVFKFEVSINASCARCTEYYGLNHRQRLVRFGW